MKNRLMNYFLDPNRELWDRAFLLMSLITYVVLFAIFIWDIAIREPLLKLVFLGIGLVLMAVAVFVGVSLNRVQLLVCIISFLMIFGLLPVEFFTGGGVYGCTPIWYAYSFLYVGINLRGRKKVVFMLSIPLSAILCYLAAYYHPEYLIPHDTRTAYLDSIASLIGVGLILYVAVTFMVVLFQKESERTNKQKTEIEELNRSQNRFFSSMSHEIRTPINTIIGLNELTLREENIPNEVAESALSIQAASKMLLTTINDILDMSKIESGRMEIVNLPYDVGGMLSEIVNLIWASARDKGLQFKVDVDTSLPNQLYGDEVRIKQILINLLNNAIKYTEEGIVALHVQGRREADNTVLVTYSVEDTGMGIKKENIPFLFDAFRRADAEKNLHIEGTGLGLAIVKQLVDLMGGSVTVNSIYTEGSTFLVTIRQRIADPTELGDLALETRHAINNRSHYRQTFEAPKAHILIVDDNDANLMVESKLLRDTQVKIDTAESGKECLEKTLAKEYHCILMDHLMPGMDGIETLQKIRNQVGGLNRETPVVVVTANAGSENQEMYQKAGFNGYVLKPVTGDILEVTLLRHLPKELVYLTSRDVIAGEDDGLFRKHKEKKRLIITTESICDLPKAMLMRLGVTVIPYRIFTEEGDFLDGVEAEADGILSYMEQDGRIAKSQAPSVIEYETFYAQQLSVAQHILHITVADEVGDGCKNATEAATAFDNVTVFRSGQISGGIGMMVILAKRLMDADFTVYDITKRLEQYKKQIHTSYLADGPEYLLRQGHINRRAAAVSKALMLHLKLGLKNGRVRCQALIPGTLVRAQERFLHTELELLGEVDPEILIMSYVGFDYVDLNRITESIKKKVPFKTVVVQKASPAVSTNCGPGTIGLAFLTKG